MEKELEPDSPLNQDDSSLEYSDKDLAAAIVPNYAQEFDAATEHKILQKIDLYLIPWMWIGYGFVYYDKVPDFQLSSPKGYWYLELMRREGYPG